MVKVLSPGEIVKDYQILQQFDAGAFAIPYKAKRVSDGEIVFMKQYKSPSIRVPWYADFLDYQAVIRNRIEGSEARGFTYRFLDFFEWKAGPVTYFQVFEFISAGHDLGKMLEKIRKNPSSVSWDQRVTLALVLLSGVAALHDQNIIHCDLKPANVQLFRDDSIAAKYRLKLIDMDFSILADRKAPWHGDRGYVGTPGYYSPEHLAGKTPLKASDVFTCGIMLYQLLADTHPFQTDDEEVYRRLITRKPPKPKLVGTVAAPASSECVATVINDCLDPDPSKRPTANDVKAVLNGKSKWPKPSPPPPAPVPAPPVPSAVPEELTLITPSGETIRMRTRTSIGKDFLKRFGPDAQFYDALQFVLERDNTGAWTIIPNTGTTNETLVNGKAIRSRTRLNDGDVISTGRESKGIVKLPMKVKLR